jgi:hypothetical protein
VSARAVVALTALALVLSGCHSEVPVAAFANAPAFDPVQFFTGHTHSWGVEEDRSGAPKGAVTTDCVGTATGSDGLHIVQHLTLPDGTQQTRDWHLQRVAPDRYEGTANDMVGTATGEVHGRSFHWIWTLTTSPGNPLLNVTMDQWMYLMDDGAMVNRTTIRKFGIIVAEVTEQFDRMP